MSTASSALPPQTEAQVSEPKRLASLFLSPAKTFRDLKVHPRWLMAFLVVSVCSLASTFVLLQKVSVTTYIRQTIENSSRAELFEQLPQEQQERQIEFGAKLAKIRLYAAPLITFIVALIVSAILMGIFNGIFGAAVSFKQSLAIMYYSLLPLALNALLVIPILFLVSDPSHVDLRNPAAASPAYFLNPATNKFMYGFFSDLDVFRIWVLCLLGLGFHICSQNSKLKLSASLSTVFVFYLLWAAGHATLLSMF
jgi:hypothetical protein